ncbi:MAG TPA: PadR family transcriptional regulator [Coriobacteriia bacterium]|nr:PadR family transcriptional regulator [Coriobacteriia bacterium]
MSVKHGILAVLDRRSMHGYDLRRDLEDELGAAWAINYGQIYSTLERMVRDGLVVQSETVVTAEAPDRKLYTITPAGRTELHRWFLAAEDDAETGRDELHAKIVLGLTGDVDVEQVIQAQRKGQLRRIGLLTERKERLDPELDFGSLLQTDLEIAKAEAVLAWLDRAEKRITKAAHTVPKGVSPGARTLTPPTAEPSSHERPKGGIRR